MYSSIGDLHAWLTPKLQNLINLATKENAFLFRICFKYYYSGLIIWETKYEMNNIARFWISAIVPNCKPYLNWLHPSTPPNMTLRNHLRKIFLRFSFNNTVLRV